MLESEKKAGSKAEIKEKIRARYKGVDKDTLTVIPMKAKTKLFEDTQEKKVAAYCRVSTGDVNQTSSYELQKNNYEEMIKDHEGWTLVDIYADEGISGTSLKHRESFNRMIEDCKQGKIDLIVTKSIARFARNIVDSIHTQRMLANLNPPVGVFFETERIYSLDSTSEMMMAVLSAAAQEESHTKSEIMNISIEQRFSRGIFLTPKLLGYDQDEEGNLVINEEEADTVRLMYYMFLAGISVDDIARILMELNRKTKKGITKWSASTVRTVLENERHCGDVLSRKTFTPDYLTHKSKKNNYDRNQYIQENHHEAIVSREIYNATMLLLKSHRCGKHGLKYPILKVIQDGALCGYAPVNLHWKGFDLNDYVYATEYAMAVDGTVNTKNEEKIYDFIKTIPLKGYQIVRSELMQTADALTLTLYKGRMKFSPACSQKLNNCKSIEILFNALEKKIAVRMGGENDYNSVFWIRNIGSKIKNIHISASFFGNLIYEFMEWDKEKKYKMYAEVLNDGEMSVLVFNLNETEIEDAGDKYYPEKWISDYGDEDEYYKSLTLQISFSDMIHLDSEPITVERDDYLDEDELEDICMEAENLMNRLKGEA